LHLRVRAHMQEQTRAGGRPKNGSEHADDQLVPMAVGYSVGRDDAYVILTYKRL
jgi:hypothetical protein